MRIDCDLHKYCLGLVACMSSVILVSEASASMPPTSCTEIPYPAGIIACLDYWGADWEPGTAGADCSDVPGTTQPGVLSVGSYCDTTGIVGVCTTDAGLGSESRLYFYNGDLTVLQSSCESALGGTWATGTVLGACNHMMAFAPPGTPATNPTCKQYVGPSWDEPSAINDCSVLNSSTFAPGELCASEGLVGLCTIGDGLADEYELHFYTGEAADLENACVNMLQGTWTLAEIDGGLMEEALAALVSDALVTVTPDSCDDDTLAALVENNGAIEFAPMDNPTGRGLIIYPGGAVDPRAYAVAAQAIATHGFFVAIVPFPGNLAIGDPMRANNVILAHPEIGQWAIAGHSLGGVTAAIYANANPFQVIEGIALWASYPPDSVDLSTKTNLKGVSLFATFDGGMTRELWDAANLRMPEATYKLEIRGGNHAQFGYYGKQENDGEALISRELQHELFVGATAHLMHRLGLAPEHDGIRAVYTRLPDLTDTVCEHAQIAVAGIGFHDLDVSQVSNEVLAYESDFISSRSSFPEDDSLFKVNISSHAHQVANFDDTMVPPIYDGEVWCKMKSQAAFVEQYCFEPIHEEQGCDAANQMVFLMTLAQMGRIVPITAIAYFFSGSYLTYAPDFAAMSGPEWLSHGVSLEDLGDSVYALEASKLNVPTVVPPPFGGAYYCQLWSPMAAAQFIADGADTFWEF